MRRWDRRGWSGAGPALVATTMLALAMLGTALPLLAGGEAAPPAEPAPPPTAPDAEEPPQIGLPGATGIDIKSADGRFRLHLWFRAQLRYSYPFNTNPRSAEDFEAPGVHSFDLQRIRIKLKGNAYRPWLGYYLEYDFKSRMLDLQLSLTPKRWLLVRLGQWKVTYNRERVDSSGKQQFVERSIVNREFTLDRQPGIMAAVYLKEGTWADLRCYVGAFNGNGHNASNDDGHPMWMTRIQWSPLGRQLPFSQSDTSFHEEPAGTLSYATVGNRSPYTRFSTQGGGQLDGFEDGDPGRYDLRQHLQELAFKYRGLSLQQELHWKQITDNETGAVTDLKGAYAQAGLFPWALARSLPRPLELALRWAWVDPDRSVPDDDRRELTLGINWFFAGHDSKLTADLSRLELDQPDTPTLRDHRFRLQWDVSF